MQADQALIAARNFVSTTFTPKQLNPEVEVELFCDENLNGYIKVRGKENPYDTLYQFNLYEQSNDFLVEVIGYGNGLNINDPYKINDYTFSSVIDPDKTYYVKRGVWDSCQPWKEHIVEDLNLDCLDRQHYMLLPIISNNSNCTYGFRLSGLSQDQILSVTFEEFYSGQQTPFSTITYTNFPFSVNTNALRSDSWFRATLNFVNGRTKTITASRNSCDEP